MASLALMLLSGCGEVSPLGSRPKSDQFQTQERLAALAMPDATRDAIQRQFRNPSSLAEMERPWRFSGVRPSIEGCCPGGDRALLDHDFHHLLPGPGQLVRCRREGQPRPALEWPQRSPWRQSPGVL